MVGESVSMTASLPEVLQKTVLVKSEAVLSACAWVRALLNKQHLIAG